jgi:hypothetical protein
MAAPAAQAFQTSPSGKQKRSKVSGFMVML